LHPVPKNKRIESLGHLRLVRAKSCVVCQKGEVDAHHLDSKGSGGSDLSTVPLCRSHHREYHAMGLILFEEKYNVNLWREAWKILHELLT